MRWLRIFLLFLMTYTLIIYLACVSVVIAAAKERIYYAEMKHLQIPYYNTKYFKFLDFSSRRYSRRDPNYYATLHYESLVPIGNNVIIDNYFYEFLSNEYRRSFVEAHFRICELYLNDAVFGGVIRNKLISSTGVVKTCPFPKGTYYVANVSIPNLPVLATFPFQNCRLYMNATWQHTNGTKEIMACGHIDVQIKSKRRQ